MTSSLNGKLPGRQEEDYRVTYIELQRILHVMEQDDSPRNDTTTTAIPVKTISALWYQGRADRCRMLWDTLQHLHPQEISPATMSSLQQRVTLACQRSDEITAGLLLSSSQETGEEAIRKRVFGSQTKQKPLERKKRNKQPQSTENIMEIEEGEDGGVTSQEDEDEDVAVLPVTPKNAPPIVVSQEDLQAQQREQMEEAIRQMAQQMKQETARIHATLKTQNATLLDELEHVTSENVQAITKVTQDVTEHVQQTWKTSIGTWTLLFVMVGVFLFTLVTILMAPKRQNAPCFLFCNDGQPSTRTSHLPVPGVAHQPISDPLCTIHRDGTRDCHSRPTIPTQQQKQKHSTETTTQQQMNHPRGQRQKQHQDKKEMAVACQLDLNGECIMDDSESTEAGARARVEMENLLLEENRNINNQPTKKKDEEDDKDESDDRGHDEDDMEDANHESHGKDSNIIERSSDQEELDRALDNMLAQAQNQGSEADSLKSKEQEELDRALDDMLAQAQNQSSEADSLKAKEQEDLDRALDDMLGRAQNQGSEADSLKSKEQEELDRALDDMLGRTQNQGSEADSLKSKEQEELDQALDCFDRTSQNRLQGSDSDPPPSVLKPDKSDNLDVKIREDSFAAENLAQEKAFPGDTTKPGDPFAAENVVPMTEDKSWVPPIYNDKPFSPKDIRRAAAQGNVDLLEGYLTIRPDFGNRDDVNGWTAWHLAARKGHTEIVEVLIRLTGKENSLLKNKDGRTAKDIAIAYWGANHAIVHTLS